KLQLPQITYNPINQKLSASRASSLFVLTNNVKELADTEKAAPSSLLRLVEDVVGDPLCAERKFV
ncbi:MAG: hypothetical protein CMM70_06570, partial [Rhodospirillaceae bacterium]|nr:hypothetical protein [Rhodospirillaceae bacterium]